MIGLLWRVLCEYIEHADDTVLFASLIKICAENIKKCWGI